MGKGDKRSKRGKIIRGSYGKSRPNSNEQKKRERKKQEAKKEA